MEKIKNYAGQLVFGLDIGTRSIVGTVGYKDGDGFVVVAQKVKEHDTRAMLDGQIHDIEKVGATISYVKEALEEEIGRRLAEVCIAAAGRVLETVTSHAEMEFEDEHLVTKEDVYTLNSVAVEKAYESFIKENKSRQKFYCVGNSVICYYLNDFHIGNLENHKARKISVDLIATFLPDEVVDGLNKAVELAGLQVANMTLEPIAAIQVAIPERYRLLNIALVDVGAGTSDISITRDGSIIAYGMIPKAGDCLTEQIALHCLTDFQMAENIKRDSTRGDVVGYEDIMGLKQTIETREIDELLRPVLEEMTGLVSDKIKELNGGKSVSAVFVVGGGGKVNGYTRMLADKLGIQPERVAIRGAEVMQKIEFMDTAIEKDSLLVTPVGICLNFYEQNNNFVFVSFNGQKVKLYDNKHLTVTDAAIQAKFPNDGFFPKRGKELEFTVDGKKKIVRGEVGDGAVITLNGKPANIHSAIKKDDIIEVQESTAGTPARMEIGQLTEFKGTLVLEINGKRVILPKFASVNGVLQSEYYEIQSGDSIEFLNYYTVEQILKFMDLSVKDHRRYYVNNAVADLGTRVYENFTVTMEDTEGIAILDSYDDLNDEMEEETDAITNESGRSESSFLERSRRIPSDEGEKQQEEGVSISATATVNPVQQVQPQASRQMIVVVNQSPVVLKGKAKYIFVDVFDFISFDLSKPQGAIVTTLNGKPAQFMEELHDGDVLEIYWRTI
ncbi:MAG: rod shape-determining protein [Lachnospiraceae bacterium]|nr:rod shape-determining protein [Lachnospiraceae bacterium]